MVLSVAAWLGISSVTALERDPARRVLAHDDFIIRVPIAQHRDPLFEWAERKGPKCVSAAMIVGAAMATPSTIDFVLRDRRRVRARLDSDCAGLDFYDGFYVEPREGSVCAKRDEIRSRAGTTCRIERFRGLEARLRH
jgi:hypothetical protein